MDSPNRLETAHHLNADHPNNFRYVVVEQAKTKAWDLISGHYSGIFGGSYYIRTPASRESGSISPPEVSNCMPLIFPNTSRSYDATRHAVRFWGYDSAIEASFFVMADALKKLQPDAGNDESGYLRAFDTNVEQIHKAASKVYVRGSRGSYDLISSNF
jgi:hypothetical protein